MQIVLPQRQHHPHKIRMQASFQELIKRQAIAKIFLLKKEILKLIENQHRQIILINIPLEMLNRVELGTAIAKIFL